MSTALSNIRLRLQHGIRIFGRLCVRLGKVGFALLTLGLLAAPPATAHPLGNFTTNSATHAIVRAKEVELLYVLDLAEIPALSVRQELGAPSRAVPVAEATQWAQAQCDRSAKSLGLTEESKALDLVGTGSVVTFPQGQAGLSTLRLECNYLARRPAISKQRSSTQDSTMASATESQLITLSDDNFPERLGWREISVEGSGVSISGNVKLLSPTLLLLRYPKGSVSSPLRDQRVSLRVSKATGDSSSLAKGTGLTSSTQVGTVRRGNDGLTEKFQALVAKQNITVGFALGAMLLALALGGLHALAPGHGKTIMAAYAVSRRGGKRDILAIGATVAITHTIGVALLGVLVSATSVVSPARTLQWASVVSGVIVFAVGATIVRSRFIGIGGIRLGFAGGQRMSKDQSAHPAKDQSSLGNTMLRLVSQHEFTEQNSHAKSLVAPLTVLEQDQAHSHGRLGVDDQPLHRTHSHNHSAYEGDECATEHGNQPEGEYGHEHGPTPRVEQEPSHKHDHESGHTHIHEPGHKHDHDHHDEHQHAGHHKHGEHPDHHEHNKHHVHGNEHTHAHHRPNLMVVRLRTWCRRNFQERSLNARSDPRFVVSSHTHGGWSHEHVLPAPGATVKRRELIAMGLAGGLIPSPSALVVLLGAIALGRVAFGIALVMAYGVGLAITLIAAGLLLVRFESGLRGVTARMKTPTGKLFAQVVQLLPLVSGFAIAGAGLLLVVRSAQHF